VDYARTFSGGGHHNLLLRYDGSLLTWGDCDSGQCDVPAGKHYIAIAAGTYHNLAIHCPLVVMDYVTVGHPDNPNDVHTDSTGGTYGMVPYTYRIGMYEVTAEQYCVFLNAVAVDDTYGLYDPRMAQGQGKYDTGCRIRRCRPASMPEEISSCSDTYTVDAGWAHRPVNFVDFWDACRFANWLHNGQPLGSQDANTTENGAYTLNGYTGDDGREILRNPNARVWIPSADEWYKAAYHKNDGVTNHYWDYPTGSDVQPSNEIIDPDPGNNANLRIDDTIIAGLPYTIGQPYWRTEVGEFENSASPYGTYDQAGNMREWTDSLMTIWGPNEPSRIQHGGNYTSRHVTGRADEMGHHGAFTNAGFATIGFRVAAESPQEKTVTEPRDLETGSRE
jgi:formylglycine-generating enzyme required for sulfatase activity